MPRGLTLYLLRSSIRELQVRPPRVLVARELAPSVQRVAVGGDGEGIALPETGCIAPPVHHTAIHRDLVPPRHATLVEVEHRERPFLIVAADIGDPARHFGRVDLG